jgi:hypothetical protein
MVALTSNGFYSLTMSSRERPALGLTQTDASAAVAIQNRVLPLNPPQVLSLFGATQGKLR